LAQKFNFVVTATKIQRPDQSYMTVPSAGIQVGIITHEALVFPTDGVTDTLIVTASGWRITAMEDFADFNTAVSAAAVTGS
jgi:hypothetical protein